MQITILNVATLLPSIVFNVLYKLVLICFAFDLFATLPGNVKTLTLSNSIDVDVSKGSLNCVGVVRLI